VLHLPDAHDVHAGPKPENPVQCVEKNAARQAGGRGDGTGAGVRLQFGDAATQE